MIHTHFQANLPICKRFVKPHPAAGHENSDGYSTTLSPPIVSDPRKPTLSIPDVSSYTRNPFAPRALPRFPATTTSSDSSFRFRYSEVSQVPGRTIATRPPTVSRLLSPPHVDWTVREGFTLGDGWPAEMYPNETLPPIHLR